MKKKNHFWFRLLTILFLAGLSVVIIWPGGLTLTAPKPQVNFKGDFPFIEVRANGNLFEKKINYSFNQGLDLKGGSYLTYRVDLSKIDSGDHDDAMSSLNKVIERRINAFGLTEPVVRTAKSGDENRLIVELPGIQNTQEALDLIGKTANLEFQEFKGEEFVSTGLTGSDLKKAVVVFDPNTNEPIISIEFNDEGSKKFAEITARMVGQPLAISLDGEVVSAPTVQQEIIGGKGQITGEFTLEEANALAIQLNAGALPAPIELIEERTIGATLGAESVNKSIFAGVIGIILICLYMLVFYRFLGLFSAIGLLLYLIFMVASMKLLGVTMTMGGIAGLILSIGMSIEADVLVFERIREELRAGHTLVAASKLGFKRAWISIRDSNAVSLIICAILYTGGGMIRGFAIVLALGIVIGLMTTFLGTRTLIDVIIRRKITQKAWLYRVEEMEKSV